MRQGVQSSNWALSCFRASWKVGVVSSLDMAGGRVQMLLLFGVAPDQRNKSESE